LWGVGRSAGSDRQGGGATGHTEGGVYARDHCLVGEAVHGGHFTPLDSL
jgi:hypothetical protein